MPGHHLYVGARADVPKTGPPMPPHPGQSLATRLRRADAWPSKQTRDLKSSCDSLHLLCHHGLRLFEGLIYGRNDEVL